MPIPQYQRPLKTRMPRTRRAPAATPVDADPKIDNPAGYQETEPTKDAVTQDLSLTDNCALLQRARAEDPANCNAELPALLTRKPRVRR